MQFFLPASSSESVLSKAEVKLVGRVPSSHARGQWFEPRCWQYFKLLLDPGDFHTNPSGLLSFNKSETVLWTIAKIYRYTFFFENKAFYHLFKTFIWYLSSNSVQHCYYPAEMKNCIWVFHLSIAMRTNSLNWCILVSISKNVAFEMVRIY